MTHAEDVYLFRHGLLRDAAYNLQPPRERADLHARAMACFEALYLGHLEVHADELVEHAQAALAQGGDSDGILRKEFSYLMLAAKTCAANWRIDAELKYLARLREHPHAGDAERAHFALRFASSISIVGSLQDGETAAAFARDAASRAGLKAEEFLASVYLIKAKIEQGAEANEGLPRLVEQIESFGPCEALKVAYLTRSVLRERQGDQAGAVEDCRRAIEVSEAIGDSGGRIEGLSSLALLYHRYRRSTEAESVIRDALKLAQEQNYRVNETEAWNILGIILIETSRPLEAAKAYESGLKLARETGNRSSEATISNNLSNVQVFILGGFSAAERQHLSNIEYMRERSDMHGVAYSNGVLGIMYLQAGEWPAARARFERVLELAISMDDQVMAAKAQMGLSRCRTPRSLPAALQEHEVAFRHLRAMGLVTQFAENWAWLADFLFESGLLRASDEAIAVFERLLKHNPVSVAPREATRLQLPNALLAGKRDRLIELAAQQDGYLPRDKLPQIRLPYVNFSRVCAASFDAAGMFGIECRPDAMEALTSEYEAMRQFGETFESDRYMLARIALQAGQIMVHELQAAIRERREATLWAGYSPEFLTPQLRNALLDRLGPTAEAELQAANPKLAAIMRKGERPPMAWDAALHLVFPAASDFEHFEPLPAVTPRENAR